MGCQLEMPGTDLDRVSKAGREVAPTCRRQIKQREWVIAPGKVPTPTFKGLSAKEESDN